MTILQKLKDRLTFRSQPRTIEVGLGNDLEKKMLVISTKEEEAKVEKRYCSTCRYLEASECSYSENLLIHEDEDHAGVHSWRTSIRRPKEINLNSDCGWWEEKENE